MSKKTLYLLGILLTISVGTFLYWKLCCCTCSSSDPKPCDCNGDKNQVAITAESTTIRNDFKINSTDFNYDCSDNFKFLNSSFNTIMPISDSINTGINNLKTHFDANPNKKLLVTGYATSLEKNTSAFPNLGFARANEIKNYFVSNGFKASQFELDGVIKDSLTTNNDTLIGPNLFQIILPETKSTSKDWDSIKTKLNANPLTLYFNTNQAEINLSASERQQVADLKEYLDNVPNAKLNAIGHSDGIGNRSSNIVLGQSRADFAKAYLVKNGIESSKIITTSKGPDEPIADNKTEAGKAKNRRIVITIQ